MKKYFLLALLVWISTDAYAQNTFEKIIDTLGCTSANCVQQTFDGGYIVCGGSSYNNNDAAMVKLDSLGNIQWVKIYGGSGMDDANHVEQLPDSTYIVSGVWNYGLNAQNWLLKLDANGDTLWTSKIAVGTYKHTPQSMANKLTNTFPVTGYLNIQGINNDAYLLLADSLGGMSFYKTYGDSLFSQGGNDVTKTFDNGYAITGEGGVSLFSAGVYLVRINSSGDTLWTNKYFKTWLNSGYSVRETTDSGFVIAGVTYDTVNLNYNVYLIKTNPYGDTLWTRVIYYPSGNVASCIQQTNNGKYIITGTIVDTLPVIAERLLLIKTDMNGDTLWTRHYAGIYAAQGHYLNETNDGGIIACGNSGNMYILKTDSDGNVATNVGLNYLVKNSDLKIFPNPTNSCFNISFCSCKSSYEIIITNSIGKVVFSCLNENAANTCNINLDSNSSGLYNVTVRCKMEQISRKILLVK